MKNACEAAGDEPPPEPAPLIGRRRLLLVDDHPFLRAGVAQLVNRLPDLVVSGEAGSVAEALRRLAVAPVDLVLTDLSLPDGDGLAFVRRLAEGFPALPVLVLSMHDEAVWAEPALRAGARGYVMKEAGGEVLLAAIRQVLAGEVHVSAAMTARLVSGVNRGPAGAPHSPLAPLTEREWEIFQLIGRGRSSRQIAELLHLSGRTVDVHRSHIRAKLELGDNAAMIRFAVRWLESSRGARKGQSNAISAP